MTPRELDAHAPLDDGLALAVRHMTLLHSQSIASHCIMLYVP